VRRGAPAHERDRLPAKQEKREASRTEPPRRWFRRYWTFGVGSGAHVLVHALLETVRDSAEHAHAGTHTPDSE